MGRPKKVKAETTNVVVEEKPIEVVEEKPIGVVEEKKKRKYTKKESKKEIKKMDILEEIEKVNMDDFKIEENKDEVNSIKGDEEEEGIIDVKKEEEVKREERKEIKWEKIEYLPMIKKEKEEEKIYDKEDWGEEEIDLYIYHTDISKCKIVTEEMMNEKKFLYQLFIYGRDRNDCIIKSGIKRDDLKIQKTYKFDIWNIHLLEDLPPIQELKKDEWRQYILFYKMDIKEMSDMMKLQRVMRKDLWFYEKYGNLIKMTIDNTYVLEHKIYIRREDKKYFLDFCVKDLLEKLVE